MATNSESAFRSPNTLKHRDLYKFTTPPWKESYRKRCKEKLAEQRERFLHRFRQINLSDNHNGVTVAPSIQQTMMEEWNEMQKELMTTDEQTAASLQMTDIDQSLLIFEEIVKELMFEEQQILSQYQELEEYSQAELNAAICCLNSDFVICPVCEKCPLFLNKGIVFCRCGLRIDTEQDAVSLEMIKHNLTDGLTQHSSCCMHHPVFGVVNQLGISNLVMSCQTCDFMFIIV